MSDKESKRGAVRRAGGWYLGRLVGGAKGAVGTEQFRLGGRILSSAYGAVKDVFTYKQCPRCREQSLLAVDDGFKCVREDICGFHAASEREVEEFGKAMSAVDARVLALAKGHDGAFTRRAGGAITISRMFWIVTLIVLCYSVSWLFDGRLGYAAQVLLVALWTAISAIRYAYAAHRLSDERTLKPLAFVVNPAMWFPSKSG